MLEIPNERIYFAGKLFYKINLTKQLFNTSNIVYNHSKLLD